MLKRYLVIISCCLLLLNITGCKTSDKNSEFTQQVTDTSSNTISPTNNPTNIPTVTSKVMPTISSSDEKDEASIVVLDDLTGFNNLKDSFLEYEFNVTRIGADKIYDTFIVEGNYDLNNDGKEDNIKLQIKGRAFNQSYIEVNDTKKEFDINNSYDGEVRLVDLNQNDSYLEVACLDEGPSGDPIYIFFRYDGANLYELGSIDAYASIDELGKLISGFHLSWQFAPSFCSAWHEIDGNMLVEKNNEIDKYLGLTYDFGGGDSYFIPFDEIPENIEIRWDEPKHFEASKVTIIDILYLNSSNRTLNFYFVEFPSGEKGLLYFWIGD
jgi:hypothetical protein